VSLSKRKVWRGGRKGEGLLTKKGGPYTLKSGKAKIPYKAGKTRKKPISDKIVEHSRKKGSLRKGAKW